MPVIALEVRNSHSEATEPVTIVQYSNWSVVTTMVW